VPTPSFLLIAGSASTDLATAVSRELQVPLCPCAIEHFPDGEVSVEVGESLRRRDVVVIQSTSPPVNDHLVELVLLADACRRAAAAHLTAIVPYFGYARSDRRQARRRPVSARAAADLLESSGVAHVVTVDVHTPQIEGFFRVPTDDVSALPVLADTLATALEPDAVVVAPDLGAVWRARTLSQRLNRPMALCLKQRRSGTEVEVTGVVGDVRDRPCVIVDDMISTGATVVECARALRDAGARAVTGVAATHAVFAPGSLGRLAAAGVQRLVVTDTVALRETPSPDPPAVQIVSVAPLVARVVRRLAAGESLRGAW
jgi:ribose-phosphate pyrophosphokinase